MEAASTGEGGGSCCRKILQTASECLFFFLKNSSCLSLLLQTSTWPLTQPNSPTRPGTIRVRAHHSPTLPSRHPQSQLVYTAPRCLSPHPYSPSDFKHPGPSWCCSNLVWQGRELLTWLSPKNSASDPVGTRTGSVTALVPTLVPGTLLSQSTLLTV